MSRFLITSWGGGGNTTPAFNLATRLGRAGHEALVLGWPDMADRATSLGIDLTTYPSVAPWPEGVPMDSDWDRMIEMLCGENTQHDVSEAIGSWRPDVVISDCMLRASFQAVARSGVKSAALCHVLYRPFADFWGDLALETDVKAMLAPADLVLVTVVPEFDSEGPLPPNTHYVGPILSPDRSDDEPLATWELDDLAGLGDPWILVSLSSTDMEHRGAFAGILEALGTLPIRALVTLGGVYPVDSLAPPANCLVRSFVPHDVVLSHVDLVLTHGGLSTVSASLAEGKPLVCIPQGRDQPLNTERVVAGNLGVALEKDADVEAIARAVERVLGDQTYRRSAEAFAAATDLLGRGAKASELLGALAAG